MLQRHYQLSSKMSVDSVFNANWKEEVEENVNGYSSLSEEVADSLLDKEIEKGEIAICFRNLKNSKTGGSDGIVGELLKYGGSEWLTCLSSYFQLYGRRRLSPGNGGRALLLIYLRKGTGKTLLTTGVLPCLVL